MQFYPVQGHTRITMLKVGKQLGQCGQYDQCTGKRYVAAAFERGHRGGWSSRGRRTFPVWLTKGYYAQRWLTEQSVSESQRKCERYPLLLVKTLILWGPMDHHLLQAYLEHYVWRQGMVQLH